MPRLFFRYITVIWKETYFVSTHTVRDNIQSSVIS